MPIGFGRYWRPRAAALLAPLLVFALVAAMPRVTAAQETEDVGATIRLVHGAPEAGPVDLYLDGDLVAEEVDPATVSDPITLGPGAYDAQIVAAGRRSRGRCDHWR